MRTKGFKRKISNLLLLGVLITIIVAIYYNIYNSKAENIIEFTAQAIDYMGYTENEDFTLEAKHIGNEQYIIEIPKEVNNKTISKLEKVYLQTVALIESEESEGEQETTTPEEEQETTTPEGEQETTTPEGEQETTTPEEEQETTTPEEEQETTTPEEEQETTTPEGEQETTTPEGEQETTTPEGETEIPESVAQKIQSAAQKIELAAGNTDNSTTNESNVEIIIEELEIQDNKIILTKEQLEKGKIVFELSYNLRIVNKTEDGDLNKQTVIEPEKELGDVEQEIQITENTEKLYSQAIKYENEEEEISIQVSGYLPEQALLEIEEVPAEKIAEIFKNGKIDTAYDIKIKIPVEKKITKTQTKEDGTTEEITETVVEYKEINPEQYEEICEVSIFDSKIKNNSKIFHVNSEDNSYEIIRAKENTRGNVVFKATSFSIYAITSDEQLILTATNDKTIPAISFSPTTNTTAGKSHSVTVTVKDEQLEEVTASTLTASDYGGTVINYNPSNGSSVGWKIFHTDGTNIYLIADDYIKASEAPEGKGGTSINTRNNRL